MHAYQTTGVKGAPDFPLPMHSAGKRRNAGGSLLIQVQVEVEVQVGEGSGLLGIVCSRLVVAKVYVA
jgi:hypothetical protein